MPQYHVNHIQPIYTGLNTFEVKSYICKKMEEHNLNKGIIVAAAILAAAGIAGCSSTEFVRQSEDSIYNNGQELPEKIKEIIESCSNIYEQAAEADTLETLETKENIMKSIGSMGYSVADNENQINMVNSDKMGEFIRKVERKEEAEIALILVADMGGFSRLDMQTSGGEVNVTQNTLVRNGNQMNVSHEEKYPANTWEYTPGGYLFFEHYRPMGYDGPCGHVAVRVVDLDEKCREMNQKYILPIGYDLNNMFITDWNEQNYGELDFNDIYGTFYEMKSGQTPPYEIPYTGESYEVPKEELENVFKSYFQIDSLTLQQKMIYHAQSNTYQYRSRGKGEFCPVPEIPYPEVVGYEENEDGTVKLTVNAVWTHKNLERAFSHEVVIRPLPDGAFQYVSNHVIPSEENTETTWYRKRMTDEEWAEKNLSEEGQS